MSKPVFLAAAVVVLSCAGAPMAAPADGQDSASAEADIRPVTFHVAGFS